MFLQILSVIHTSNDVPFWLCVRLQRSHKVSPKDRNLFFVQRSYFIYLLQFYFFLELHAWISTISTPPLSSHNSFMSPTPSQIHDINRNCIRKDLSEPIILENYYEANIKHTTKANQTTLTREKMTNKNSITLIYKNIKVNKNK